MAVSVHKLTAYQLLEPAMQMDDLLWLKCITGHSPDLLTALLQKKVDIFLQIRCLERGNLSTALDTIDPQAYHLYQNQQLDNKGLEITGTETEPRSSFKRVA